VSQLARYDAMCRAIDAAYKVDEVKDIRDKARAIEMYARQAQNVEAESQACRIRLRAERKWGQLRKKEVVPAHRQKEVSADPTLNSQRTLPELGVSRDQSAQWQKLAEIPDEQFEQALTAERPTTNGIIAAHFPKGAEIDAIPEQALWVWGRLLEFQRTDAQDAAVSTCRHANPRA
jgi:hypothetical protein